MVMAKAKSRSKTDQQFPGSAKSLLFRPEPETRSVGSKQRKNGVIRDVEHGTEERDEQTTTICK